MSNAADQDKIKLANSILELLANTPAAMRADVLCGLMTRPEMEMLLQRDRIRAEIETRLRNGDSIFLSSIARECGASTDTVQRVWQAIRDEYPLSATPATDLKIALPKESRAFAIVEETLLESGFRVEVHDKRTKDGAVVDIKNGLAPVPFKILRGEDILTYMKAGAINLAFLGKDKLWEVAAAETAKGMPPIEPTVRKTFREGSFRMALAIPKEKQAEAEHIGLAFLEGKKVATSYPATLNKFLGENGIKAGEVMVLKGGVEAAPATFGADAIADIVETGGSLRSNGLVQFGEPIYQANMSLFSLQNELPQEASRFINRLQATRYTA